MRHCTQRRKGMHGCHRRRQQQASNMNNINITINNRDEVDTDVEASPSTKTKTMMEAQAKSKSKAKAKSKAKTNVTDTAVAEDNGENGELCCPEQEGKKIDMCLNGRTINVSRNACEGIKTAGGTCGPCETIESNAEPKGTTKKLKSKAKKE